MLCPACKQPKAHRSHAKGLKDKVLRLFQQIPYRCRGCNHRFYTYRSGEQSSNLRTTEERKIMELRRRIKWKAKKKEVILYTLGALTMVVAVYLMTRPRFG